MPRLAIDTTAEACSVALDTGSEVLQRYQHAPRRHGELILPWADELLAEAGLVRRQLDGICVSRGPGSFTSLRLGFSVALGMAGGLDLPVYPVSSLQTLALQAARQGGQYIIAALDARMEEVYIASYRANPQGIPELIGAEQLCSAKDFQPPSLAEPVSWQAIGSGFAALQGALQSALADNLDGQTSDGWPQARDVLILARQVAPVAAHQAELIYLRNQVVQT